MDECAVEDLPLDGVGVLELVDEHDLVARAQAAGGRAAARPGERAVQAGQQVVVSHDRQLALAAFELAADRVCESVAHRRDAGLLGREFGLELVVRVEHGRARDLERLCTVERGPAVLLKAANVEVVEHLFEQVADVLDELGVGLEVAERSQLREHLLAEPVGRRDRGGVEVGDRADQPVAAPLDLLLRPGREELDNLVGARIQHTVEDAGELLLADDEALAHAVAELASGDPRECDQQHSLERHSVSDVARREGGDRVGLAGAGTRLEHSHAGREWPRQNEFVGHRRRAHRSTSRSCASNPSHRRSAYRANRWGAASGHPGGRSPARGASARRSANARWPPNTSRCSGWRSSLS